LTELGTFCHYLPEYPSLRDRAAVSVSWLLPPLREGAVTVHPVVTGIRRWQVWSAKGPLCWYLMVVPLLAAVALGVAARGVVWQPRQVLVFVALAGAAVMSVEATVRINEPHGGVVRDFQSIWYLPLAVILPPFYALLAPCLVTFYKVRRQRPAIVYRRVFSCATVSLAYGCASVLFRSILGPVAGVRPGLGVHAVTWTAAVAACGAAAWLVNHLALLPAVRASRPAPTVREMLASAEAVSSDVAELSLAVAVTLIVAISPFLIVLAVPSVLTQRCFFTRIHMSSHGRIDAVTGLLNDSAWRVEAASALLRAQRASMPVALAIAEVDGFGEVSETATAQMRDQLLRQVGSIVDRHVSGADLGCRLGICRFAILLPGVEAAAARGIAELMGNEIAGTPFTAESGSQAQYVFRMTVSIGVAAITPRGEGPDDLLAAAESALRDAKDAGWSKISVVVGSPAAVT
jgi:diguanylate cyclase (GGDEF)-like protein